MDDETNVFRGYVVVHDSAKTIHVHLKNVPDDAAPQLLMFAELDLTGPIKGEGKLKLHRIHQ